MRRSLEQGPPPCGDATAEAHISTRIIRRRIPLRGGRRSVEQGPACGMRGAGRWSVVRRPIRISGVRFPKKNPWGPSSALRRVIHRQADGVLLRPPRAPSRCKCALGICTRFYDGTRARGPAYHSCAPPLLEAQATARRPVDLRLRVADVASRDSVRAMGARAGLRLSPRAVHLFEPLARHTRASRPGAGAGSRRRVPRHRVSHQGGRCAIRARSAVAA